MRRRVRSLALLSRCSSSLGAFALSCGLRQTLRDRRARRGPRGSTRAATSRRRSSAYCMVSVDEGRRHAERGVTPYDLNTPLFSDYAVKYRTVWLPPSTSRELRGATALRVPGRHGDHQVVRLPGRLPRAKRAREVDRDARARQRRRRGGRARATSGTTRRSDARVIRRRRGRDLLVHRRRGPHAVAELPRSQPGQCKKCHANDGDDDHARAERRAAQSRLRLSRRTENELAHWSKRGPSRGRADRPRARRSSRSWTTRRPATSPSRARAYLQANCVYCHNGDGEARTTGLVLSNAATAIPTRCGICKPPVAAGKAAANEHYDIVPGHPEQSILLYRMQSTAPSIMMPRARAKPRARGGCGARERLDRWPLGQLSVGARPSDCRPRGTLSSPHVLDGIGRAGSSIMRPCSESGWPF